MHDATRPRWRSVLTCMPLPGSTCSQLHHRKRALQRHQLDDPGSYPRADTRKVEERLSAPTSMTGWIQQRVVRWSARYDADLQHHRQYLECGYGITGGAFRRGDGSFQRPGVRDRRLQPTGTGHNEVYIYNPGTNSYTTGAPMTATQGNVAGVLFNGEIYVVGGGTAPGAQYAYNPTTNMWRTIALLPTTGGTCQSDNGFVLDNELWVVGCLGLPINQQVWIYNPGVTAGERARRTA